MTTNNDESSYEKALGFWTVGGQYLHLAKTVANETVAQGNAHVVVADHEISLDEYDQKTKWSDHNLVIPVLFNFYHGLEVTLKGFLCVRNPALKPSHKLSKLLKDFIAEYGYTEFGDEVSKYILPELLPELLSDFLSTSNISIDDYYQSLKYAESVNGNKFHHHPLKYKGEAGVSFYEALTIDIMKIMRLAVALGRKEHETT